MNIIERLQADSIKNDHALVDPEGVVRDVSCKRLMMSALRSLGSRGMSGYIVVWFPHAMVGDVLPELENLYEEELCG